jgi:hypothetical protein
MFFKRSWIETLPFHSFSSIQYTFKGFWFVVNSILFLIRNQLPEYLQNYSVLQIVLDGHHLRLIFCVTGIFYVFFGNTGVMFSGRKAQTVLISVSFESQNLFQHQYLLSRSDGLFPVPKASLNENNFLLSSHSAAYMCPPNCSKCWEQASVHCRRQNLSGTCRGGIFITAFGKTKVGL